jgi:cytochrome oxidase Cu insertion factor (SCO1/SenC/PrrC family)
MSEPSASQPRAFNPLAIWIPIIIIVLGVVVLNAYLMREKQRLATEEKERPPIYGRLEQDLTLTERSGKTVHLSDLRGKIIIASWVFTRCPRGCAGVLGKLKQLHQELKGNPDVFFVSFTLDPDDTSEMMKKFADGLSIGENDQWWFVNGNKDEVRAYMEKHFQFRPVKDMPMEERLSPDDKYIHDLRVAVADARGHVRGLYDIMNADPEFQKFFDEKLRKDLAYIIKEKKEGR